MDNKSQQHPVPPESPATIETLQDVINQRAYSRFLKDLTVAQEKLTMDPILSLLVINKSDIDRRLVGANNSGIVLNTDYGSVRALDVLSGLTNIGEIKDALIKRYAEEETDKLLRKVNEADVDLFSYES